MYKVKIDNDEWIEDVADCYTSGPTLVLRFQDGSWRYLTGWCDAEVKPWP